MTWNITSNSRCICWTSTRKRFAMKKKPIQIDWKELFEAYAELVIEGKEKKKEK